MKDEEILEFLKDNPDNNYNLNISASISAILTILIKNNITTQEEYREIKKCCLKELQKYQVEQLSKEEKEKIVQAKKINDFLTSFGLDKF